MDLDEVASLLDADLTLKIGEEKGTRRIHRLFFSREDRQCFIAIQDEKNKTVVTILPVDYYETLAAKIPVSLLAEAEQLVSCPPPSPAVQASVNLSVETPVKRSFKLNGTFMSLKGKPITINLGSWPADDYQGSIVRLLQDSAFFREIQVRANTKKQVDYYMVGLMIRMSKKSEPVWVNIEDDGFELICKTTELTNLDSVN